MLPPLARTTLEAYLYMALHPCSCGHAEVLTSSGLRRVDDVWVVRYFGTCSECGRSREFEFTAPDEFGEPVGDAWADTQEPSQLLDAGEWLLVADSYGEAPAEPDGLSPEQREQAAADLGTAAASLDEVLKFLPPGADQAPDSAFWSDRGPEVRSRQAGRFRRIRLEAARDTYLELAAAMAEGTSQEDGVGR